MAAPSVSALVGRIRRAVQHLPVTYSTSTVAAAYEAYCWMLTIEAVTTRTRTRPLLQNLGGNNAIRLPGAPARFPTRFTYAEFPCGWEVHAGIRATGRSGIAHQLDTSVIQGAAYTHVSAERGVVAGRHVLLAVEAKCYSGSLPLGIARAGLGLNSDIYGRFRLITNLRHQSVGARHVVHLLAARTQKAEGLVNVRPDARAFEICAVSRLAAALP